MTNTTSLAAATAAGESAHVAPGVDERVGLGAGPRGHRHRVTRRRAGARTCSPPSPRCRSTRRRTSSRLACGPILAPPAEIVRSPDQSYIGHMLSDGTLVIDADSHFTERHDLFTELAPEKYKDRVPHVETIDDIPTWVFDGHPLGPRQRRRGDRQGRPEGERRPRAQPLGDRGHARRLVRPEGAPRCARRVRHRRADHVPEHRRPRRPGPRHGRRRRRSASS